jgi:hypothetical protein
MKKAKNGFIATSIIYSFFIVFALLALTILGMYMHYRTLVNSVNNSVLNDLNENIEAKYVQLTNIVENSGFENTTGEPPTPTLTPWGVNNASLADNTSYNSIHSLNNSIHSLKFNVNKSKDDCSAYQNMAIGNAFSKDNSNHKIYVRFRLFIKNITANSSEVFLKYNNNNYYFADNNVNVLSDTSKGFNNWVIKSEIFDIRLSSNDSDDIMQLSFQINGIKNTTDEVYIDEVMIVDVSKYIQDKDKLDNELPYFDGSKYFTKD